MASIINATTTNGVAISADNSGILQLATNSGTTALTLSAAQAATFVSSVTATSLTAPILSSATTLSLQTNGSTTAVTIDASQNVGIGTTSPAYKLDVSQNVNNDGAIQITNANAGTSTISEFRASNGTNVAWYGIGGTGYTGYAQIRANGAAIYCNTSAGIGLSADNAAGYITFGTGSSASERMRIDSSGNVLVGTTSGVYSGKLSVSYLSASQRGICVLTDSVGTTSQVAFNNPNGAIGAINTTASSTAYVTSSDYRLKEAILPMVGALDTIAQLKPVTYNWKADGSAGQGFIAHELQAVVPDCVSGEKDAVNEDGTIKPQGIDTSFLVATLTSAIQEQQALITTLQTQITLLNAKVGI